MPSLPIGTDTLPGIDHIVILMLENHTFDNLLGMLGRGGGFTLDAQGNPTATDPYPDGRIQHAFHMPTTCQLHARPSNEWAASHTAFDGGKNDGFVRTEVSPSTPQIVGGVAMGYWTGADLPFTYSLASTFPIGDRWFSSALAQTDPERRYLIAATSSGMTDDISLDVQHPSLATALADADLLAPTTRTIFNELDLYRISWSNYVVSWPTGATPNLYPEQDGLTEILHKKPLSAFAGDAAAGALPQVSLIDPDYGTQSQENPQNIVVGERLLSDVVHAVGSARSWGKTMLVVTYDEGGGYYDHVPPPAAVAPDLVPPVVRPGESRYDGFRRYGFRVPAIVVSPYAKRDYVSHVVYDHTSILAMIERKWNLPALTFRDANANDLRDFLDLPALAARTPTFPALPALAAPGDTQAALACSNTGPGVVPPPGSISGP